MSDYRIAGATGEWEVVIGLEVHAQITSRAKLFSGASTEFGGEPNTHVSLVDAAMPGMLPVLNEECVRQAVRTGMALEARINAWSRFDRKNYFYADLPQGYQISQLYHPLVGEGALVIDTEQGSKTIGIERIHIEQDAGKLMHDQHPSFSYVDLNRCGVALMEIVSKPDMRSPAEAGAYVKKLRSILRYVGSCDGNMEQGSMVLDADEKLGIGSPKPVGIERIHIEQDAGKLMHDQHPNYSYVDLNRSGVALMEIVSKTDMRSPAEAGAYLRKLRAILRYVGSCDGNMEEGSMRADVNVSVRKPGPNGEEAPFGTRTETKNVNSVRFVMQVVEHEARRQVELIEEGGTVAQ